MSSTKTLRLVALTIVFIVAIIFLVLMNGPTRRWTTFDLHQKVKGVNIFTMLPNQQNAEASNESLTSNSSHNATSLTVKPNDAKTTIGPKIVSQTRKSSDSQRVGDTSTNNFRNSQPAKGDDLMEKGDRLPKSNKNNNLSDPENRPVTTNTLILKDTAIKSMPKDSIQIKSIPKNPVRANSIPKDSTPNKSVPKNMTPIKSIPKDRTPVQSTPKDTQLLVKSMAKITSSVKEISKVGKTMSGSDVGMRWHTDLDSLVQTLTERLEVADVKLRPVGYPCGIKANIANSCDKGKKCLRTQLPKDIKGRVAQLVNSPKLQLTKEYQTIFQEMADEVKGQYDVILLTGASSNHFFESQAMIKNVHQYVFPVVKSLKFLFYNLGLTSDERQAMVKYCQCQVLDFPFDKFPDFVRNLECFSWKPIMIKAHVRQANVLIWADASVRFDPNPDYLMTLVNQARERGLQIGGSNCRSPFRTWRTMYHYFGDEPCVYLHMGQAKATVGFYSRDPFVDRAILEPWAACAVHKACMCMNDPSMEPSNGCADSKKLEMEWLFRKGKLVYGMCHRFDQSAISVILHKLYQEKHRWVMVDVKKFLEFRRRNTTVYFPD